MSLGVFIELSKAFIKFYYKTLIEICEKHETKHQYLDWFKSYLNSRK